MKFFTYSQNNSLGKFKAPALFVIVEAANADDANKRAVDAGLYFDGVDDGFDCDCCGDRWSRAQDSDGTWSPTIYGKPAEEHESDPLETLLAELAKVPVWLVLRQTDAPRAEAEA